MIREIGLLLLALPVAAVVGARPASADNSGCGSSTNLYQAHTTCTYTADKVKSLYQNAAAGHHEYRLDPHCAHGGLCHQLDTCYSNSKKGTWYEVYRDNVYIGLSCLTDTDAAATHQVTPAMVLQKFRSLTWARGELAIQPPKGITLVNMATVFSTTTTGHQTRPVTLLGQHITIEAWPASYTWIHGDGTQQTTTIPGKPIHPPPGVAIQDVDLAGTVNHRYRTKGDVQVRLDLTYQGRYRVNNGPWTDIPGALTVTGTPQDLSVRTARPALVG